MQLAECTIYIDRYRTTVNKKGVTPAQLAIWRECFGRPVGGDIVVRLKVTGDAKRTSMEEFQRLKKLIVNRDLEKVYPGKAPVLPQTFEDVGFKEKEPRPEEFTPGLPDIHVRDDEVEKD